MLFFFSLGHCPEKYGTTRNTAVKGTRLFLSLSFKFKLRTAEAPSLILRKKKRYPCSRNNYHLLTNFPIFFHIHHIPLNPS